MPVGTGLHVRQQYLPCTLCLNESITTVKSHYCPVSEEHLKAEQYPEIIPDTAECRGSLIKVETVAIDLPCAMVPLAPIRGQRVFEMWKLSMNAAHLRLFELRPSGRLESRLDLQCRQPPGKNLRVRPKADAKDIKPSHAIDKTRTVRSD